MAAPDDEREPRLQRQLRNEPMSTIGTTIPTELKEWLDELVVAHRVSRSIILSHILRGVKRQCERDPTAVERLVRRRKERGNERPLAIAGEE